jgi:hypothetical protein
MERSEHGFGLLWREPIAEPIFFEVVSEAGTFYEYGGVIPNISPAEMSAEDILRHH